MIFLLTQLKHADIYQIKTKLIGISQKVWQKRIPKQKKRVNFLFGKENKWINPLPEAGSITSISSFSYIYIRPNAELYCIDYHPNTDD